MIRNDARPLVRPSRPEDPRVTTWQQARRIFDLEQRHAGAIAGSRVAPAPIVAFMDAVRPHAIVRLFTGDRSGERLSS